MEYGIWNMNITGEIHVGWRRLGPERVQGRRGRLPAHGRHVGPATA